MVEKGREGFTAGRQMKRMEILALFFFSSSRFSYVLSAARGFAPTCLWLRLAGMSHQSAPDFRRTTAASVMHVADPLAILGQLELFLPPCLSPSALQHCPGCHTLLLLPSCPAATQLRLHMCWGSPQAPLEEPRSIRVQLAICGIRRFGMKCLLFTGDGHHSAHRALSGPMLSSWSRFSCMTAEAS